jgi:sulfatase maturation enzyme AslB (radical SAM superfamily)
LAAAQYVFMTLVTEVTDSNLVHVTGMYRFLSSLLKKKKMYLFIVCATNQKLTPTAFVNSNCSIIAEKYIENFAEERLSSKI